MDEATALLITLSSTDPYAPTACVGWNAHDLVAHLAAGAAEMATHAERALAGEAEQATTGFAEREAPYVAMEDDHLRGRLLTEALRLNTAVEEMAERELTLSFSGRLMSASELQMHGRSEAALHRWDLCRDDDIGEDLLGQPDLTRHAVTVLNSMVSGSGEAPQVRATAAGLTRPGRFEFGSPDQLDVVLVVDDTGARFELASPVRSPVAMSDPVTRLLALWGRRSPDRKIEWHGSELAAEQLTSFLWGQKVGS